MVFPVLFPVYFNNLALIKSITWPINKPGEEYNPPLLQQW